MSATTSPRMPARYFALLCDLMKRDGYDVGAILARSRIWPTQIEGPDASLTLRQIEALIDGANKMSGRTDLAFELGRHVKLSTHEILGYGILTSATVDYALQLAARYFGLITPMFRMEYRRSQPHCELRFRPAMRLSVTSLQFLLETVIVSFHEQLMAIHGPLPPYDVHVSYAEPPHVRRYRELKPARFLFEHERLPGARAILEAETMARPLPMADRHALKMAEARCEELLRKTAGAGRITEWVTMMLRESHEGLPTLGELAHLLNQSPRTLDRHLSREGARFLELSKRIRHERACELLSAGLTVTQTAIQLGYRDVANFTRAFRRESGTSPSAYLCGQPRP